ncbi:VPDSG-CTERM sorting domain-containing protein [Pelagicoccus sp. SDUM812005]|nr:VPDSG-CTERM sorting domain-containing protein [Pelagicoccus sp. SDUM812005]
MHLNPFLKFVSTITFTVGLASTQANAINLITNGNFETGTLVGWSSGDGISFVINDDSNDFGGPATQTAPINGLFDAFSIQGGPSISILSQMVELPTDIAQLALSWSDRIQNFGGSFDDPGQEFRVSFYNSADLLIATVFSTDPGDDTIQLGPHPRSFDVASTLSAYAGESVKLQFEAAAESGPFNVNIDDVRLDTVPDAGSTFVLLLSASALLFGLRRKMLNK